MPNYETHEVFLADFEYELQCQLCQISSQDGIALTTAEFAEGIVNRRRSTIYYPPPFSTTKKETERSPDSSWVYRGVHKPSCIIEVANSQTTKNVAKLAEEYIWGTNAAVRTVVGFDFDSRTKKGATMSVWRAKLNNQGNLTGTTCDVVEIRDKDGQRNQDPEAGLRLLLEDFAFRRPGGTFDGLDQVSIFIPVGHLCDTLELAEEQYRLGNGSRGIDDSVPLAVAPVSESPVHRYNLRSRR